MATGLKLTCKINLDLYAYYPNSGWWYVEFLY